MKAAHPAQFRIRVLCALAALASASAAAPFFSLTADCGGVGDGATRNDAAWRACLALAAGAAPAPATIFVPAGRFLSGPFNVTVDALTILLGPNATLVADATNALAAWPLILPLPSLGSCREYTTYLRYSAFVTVLRARGVAIVSNATAADERGTLDGQGAFWWLARKDGSLKNDPGAIIETYFAQDTTIENLRVLNSPYWHIHPFASQGVTVRGCLVSSSHDGPETDGVDPDSSSDVLIEDCVIDTGDDAIAVKSGWDLPGLLFNMSSHDILVRNTILSTGANAFCMGSEMSGGIFNVACVNCTCADVDVCFRGKSSLGRGSFIRNISMTDTTVILAKTAIDVSDYYGGHPGPVNASLVPRVGGFSVLRMAGTLIEKAGNFEGLPQSNVTGISLEDVRLDAPAGSWACVNVTGSWRNVTPAITPAACAAIVEE
jgi:hypothetical protein